MGATRTTRKSAKKSAPQRGRPRGERTAPGRPFVAGADPRRGRGPAKGAPNAGRPPDEFKEMCRRLLADPRAERAVAEILCDKNHPAFATMWRAVSDRAYGRPTQPLEHSG